jgi:hypothetical protein
VRIGSSHLSGKVSGLFLREQLVGLAQAVGKGFHDVRGKKGVELDDGEEPALVNLRKPAFAARNDGGDARCLVYERHLADDGTALGLFNHGVADDDVERAFEQDEHDVAGVARLEEGLAGRKVDDVGLV